MINKLTFCSLLIYFLDLAALFNSQNMRKIFTRIICKTTECESSVGKLSLNISQMYWMRMCHVGVILLGTRD